MKKNKITTILIMVICFYGNSQTIELNEESKKYQSQGIERVDSTSKKELYKKAKEWIAINYTSTDDVIQLGDEENGKIILKGNFPSRLFGKKGWIRHSLILDFKDNKFRYKYFDLSYYSLGSGEMPFERKMMSKKKVISTTEQEIKNSIQSIKNYLESSSNKDDW